MNRMPDPGAWRHQTVRLNGIDLHLVEAGPSDGPLVIFLHGFPEFWYAWHDQIEAFAAAGYRVFAPDQRGYNTSSRPPGASAYHANKTASDIVGLIDWAGRRQAVLVGHDWGGHAAWWTAACHASRVERLVVLNAAHPNVMFRNVLLNPRQAIKSWYVLFFQVPWVPEFLLSCRDFALLRRLVRWDGDHGPMSPEEERRYIAAWSQPHAFKSMINWYRAAVRVRPRTLDHTRITVPILLIWGDKDQFLDRSLAEQSMAYCDSGRLVHVPEASHWMHHERPDKVATLIHEFLTERGSARAGPS